MPTEWSDDIVIAELSDEPALSEELNAVIERLGQGLRTPHVVLNFAGVTYINSSNLAQVLRVRSLVNDRGRQVRLCSVSEDVESVMRVTGLDKLFHVVPDPLTALTSLQMVDEQD